MGTITAGLEGVIAGESEICYIDGYQGILSYRGYNIHTLAENAIFEEVIFLLWNGWLPKQAELDQLKKDLAAARGLPAPVVEFLRTAGKANTMDVLRTAVSMLSLYDDEAQDMSAEANYRKAVRLMSKTADIVTTYDRLRKNEPHHSGRPGPRLLGELPLHPDRQASGGHLDGARLRRRHDAARRPRAERVDLRGARDRRDALRYLLVDHERHRGAEGAAARRGEPGRDQAAARNWAARTKRPSRVQEHAGQKGEDSGLRASRLSHRGSARHASARALRGARQAHWPRAALPHVEADGRDGQGRARI